MPTNRVSVERLREVAEKAMDVGTDAAAEHFGLSRETVRRYRRLMDQIERNDSPYVPVDHTEESQPAILKKLAERYSAAELAALAKGHMPNADVIAPIHDFTGETVRIGVLSDTHFGSKYTNPEFVYRAFDEFHAQSIHMIVHCGDLTEGIPKRQGHVYECTHIGVDAQVEHSAEVMSQWSETDIYVIDGNHDAWAMQAAGVNVVHAVCDRVPNMFYLGSGEGDIHLNKKTILRLWHGLDGSSYAHSYRLQKLLESFTGGEKPNALFAGHVHKALYCYDRHVHCLSAGSIQSQSRWMRGKRLPSHTGFWIVEMVINKLGIGRFTPTWYPFYV